MRKFILTAALAIAAALPLAAEPQTWVVDKSHSEVTFDVKHMMSKVRGRFDDFSGTVIADPAKPAASSVEFTIKSASVNTNTADRDKHLRTGDFFDSEKYPDITFKSTSIKPTKQKDVYAATGNLTIRGVTKQVTLPVTYLGTQKDPYGNTKAGFEVATKINRKDYGLNWNKALDNGGWLVGDDVNIDINIEAVKK
ncbi:MAG TPA: YceI family protein [Thermoanaerobaculia bacterium]|jgi:polyisoprenoid-binding protein YceI|nr:YceI family protein [Thermoanaerobaculia bacterium]